MAGYQNLFINQAETFSTSLTLTDYTGAPYNLEGFTVKSSAKRSYYSKDVALNFTPDVTNGVGGVVTLNATAEQTANLISSVTYVYDVIVIDNVYGNVTRVLEGQIFVSPSVTQP